MTDRAVSHWPLPVARAYANFAASRDVKERHDRGFAVFEVLLKYVASVFIADYVRGQERDHRLNAALKGLARPSLGEWVGFLRELLRFGKEVPEHRQKFLRGVREALLAKEHQGALLELHGALTELTEKRQRQPASISLLNLLELLVRYRNWGSGHGAPLPRDVYERLAATISGALEAFLAALEPLRHLRLLVAASAGDGGAHAFSATSLERPLTAAAMDPASLTQGVHGLPDLVPGRLYVQGDGALCDCHPLLIFENDDVYFLNSGLDERRLRVEYLSYSTGDHLVPRNLEEDQRRLLGFILGHDVSREEFTRIVTSLTSETSPSTTEGSAKVLGDYTLIRELGRGGMGIVYEAFQRTLGRRVALKTLLPGADARALARFQREARAAAKLHHRHIVPVYEVGEAGESHFISMELIEGPNLGEIIAGERGRRESAADKGVQGAPWEVAVWVGRMRDAARALHHAHEAGIVHRDVKPQNFLLDPSGCLMLLDFGLVKDETDDRLTLSEERPGTVRYMSPEQITKQPLERTTDVWSLGATLYEVLTLHPAFEGEGGLELEKAITGREPIAPRKWNRQISRDLETIVLKAMEKAPGRRYATAADLADDLDRFLKWEPIRARPPTLPRRVARAMLRHRTVSVAGIVAVGILLVLGAGAWYRRHAALRNDLAAVDRACLGGDPAAAIKVLTYLRQEFRGSPAVEASAAMLSRILTADGLREWKTHEELKENLKAIEATWQRLELSHETWQPPWERKDEYEAWEAFQRAAEGIEERYNSAVSFFSQARDLAPPGSGELLDSKKHLERAYMERRRRSLSEGSLALDPAFFEKLIESLGLGTYAEELEGAGRVGIVTKPAGAEVFCFRYEPFEARLIPLPFDPRAGRQETAHGLLGQPFLRVDKVWDERLSPFRAGDRFLAVCGREVRLGGDLATALAKVKGDEAVAVKVHRSGRDETLTWMPFPAGAYGEGRVFPWSPGRVVTIRGQFGFTLEGYPLDFHPRARIGLTQEGTPLEVDLAGGSYLFVLRKEGYVPARFPVSAPRQASVEEIRLIPEGDLPPGFVCVPAGPFSYGGDEEAYESAPRGVAALPDYFIGKFEVTVKEWLEFLNDPEVKSRLHSHPDERVRDREPVYATVTVDWNSEKLRALKPKDDQVRLVPTASVCVREASGTWRENTDPRVNVKLDWPVPGISLRAALEYLRWRNGRPGERWRYRLPTELEWEKAARGVDRRTFVWGDYLTWCYCRCESGGYRPSRIEPVGACPEDESVFGVRDMAGSLREVAMGRRMERARYAPVRGGDWNSSDRQHFHIANLNGQLPEQSFGSGFRLVAAPLDESSGKE